MIYKWFKIFTVAALGIALTWSLTSVLTGPMTEAVAQGPTPGHKISIGPSVRPISPPGGDHPFIGIAATVDRNTTAVFESYQPLLTVTLVATDTWTGPIPTPFTYGLSGLAPDQLQGLTFSSGGGGSCSQQVNNDIVCTGTINNLQISFRTYYTPSVFGNTVVLGWGGNSTFDVDHTIDHFYPAPLEYLGSSVTPILHTGNQIRWQQADSQSFFPLAYFRDSRIKVVYLPLVLK